MNIEKLKKVGTNDRTVADQNHKRREKVLKVPPPSCCVLVESQLSFVNEKVPPREKGNLRKRTKQIRHFAKTQKQTR